MKTISKKIDDFLGIMTHMDASQLPFGAAISCRNFAQYDTGKIQRVPGITKVAVAVEDGSVRIPLTILLVVLQRMILFLPSTLVLLQLRL